MYCVHIYTHTNNGLSNAACRHQSRCTHMHSRDRPICSSIDRLREDTRAGSTVKRLCRMYPFWTPSVEIRFLYMQSVGTQPPGLQYKQTQAFARMHAKVHQHANTIIFAWDTSTQTYTVYRYSVCRYIDTHTHTHVRCTHALTHTHTHTLKCLMAMHGSSQCLHYDKPHLPGLTQNMCWHDRIQPHKQDTDSPAIQPKTSHNILTVNDYYKPRTPLFSLSPCCCRFIFVRTTVWPV